MSDVENESEQYQDEEVLDPERMKAELFGDEGDDDEEYEAPPQREPEAPPARSEAEERRARLAMLAQRKRTEEQDDDEGAEKPEKKRKKKAEKSDKGEKKRSGGRLANRRSSGAVEKAPPARGGGGRDDDSDVDSRELRAGDEDNGFIDDDGLAPEERYGSDEDADAETARLENAAEAEEEGEDEIDALINKNKRRRRKEADSDLRTAVDMMATRLEAAAEMDMRLQSEGKPATEKLSAVRDMEDFLSQTKYQEHWIDGGGLGVLKAWLEPYTDGTLPNIKVRSAVLRVLQLLPLDTCREDHKSLLKKSELGTRVMFLFKCTDETAANRRIAQELIHTWSRGIFKDDEAEGEKRARKMRQLEEARRLNQRQQQQQQEKLQQQTEARRALKPGDPGYRFHAMIPQASKLDYVQNPQSQDASLLAAADVKPAKNTALQKKLRELQRKRKGGAPRAMVPSVEGRNIVLQHN